MGIQPPQSRGDAVSVAHVTGLASHADSSDPSLNSSERGIEERFDGFD